MSLKRHFAIVSFTLLLSRALYPCNIVVIGGYTPIAVGQLSGTVVGSGRLSLMGHSHDEARHSITLPGATISVRTRIDTAFFKKGEIKYPHATKHSAGNLKDWKCGSEVSEVKTDQVGNFRIIGIPPGKYRLDITGPQPENDSECGSRTVGTVGDPGCLPQWRCAYRPVSRLEEALIELPSGKDLGKNSRVWKRS
jgi:hypothetical protein